MKKQDMILRMAGALLLTSAFLVSCSKDNGKTPIPSEEDQAKFFTLNVKAGLATKALSDLGDGTLSVNWEAGDSVSVFNLTTEEPIIGKLYALSDGGSTTLSSDKLFGNINQGDELLLEFGIKDNYSIQDGTLTGAQTSIDKCSDYATAIITVTSVEPEAVPATVQTTSAQFERRQAIVKFSLKNRKATPQAVKTDSLTIYKGETLLATVKPEVPTDQIYVALPQFEKKDTITITARGSEDGFSYKLKHVFDELDVNVGLKEGKFYARELQMKKLIKFAADSLRAVETVTYNGQAQNLVDPAGGYLYAEVNGQRVFIDGEPDKYDKKCQLMFAVKQAVSGENVPTLDDIDDSDWKTTATAISVGTYYVFTKVQGNDDFEDVDASELPTKPFVATLGKGTPTLTGLGVNNLTYTGQNQTLLNNLGTVKVGDVEVTATRYFSLDGENWKTAGLLQAKDQGSYTIHYMIVGNDNLNEVTGTWPTPATISKGQQTIYDLPSNYSITSGGDKVINNVYSSAGTIPSIVQTTLSGDTPMQVAYTITYNLSAKTLTIHGETGGMFMARRVTLTFPETDAYAEKVVSFTING